MKKYGSEIVMGIIVFIIIIPMAIVGLMDVKLFSSVETDNDWIGFWGGYLGSIVGGIITLIVMYFTLKEGRVNQRRTFDFEKDKHKIERKVCFNDELLRQLIEYQTAIEKYELFLSRVGRGEMPSDDFGIAEVEEKLVVLGKLIIIKLESKKHNDDYKSVEELLRVIISISTEINAEISACEKNPIELAKKMEEKAELLIDVVENYYVVNEDELIVSIENYDE